MNRPVHVPLLGPMRPGTPPAGRSRLAGRAAALALFAVLAGACASAPAAAPGAMPAPSDDADVSRGLRAETMQLWGEARSAYEAASSRDASLLVSAARACLAEGRPWDAAALLERGLSSGSSPELIAAGADALLAAGAPDAAVEGYRQALSLRPGDPSFSERLAWALFSARRYSEVVDLLGTRPPASLSPHARRVLGRSALFASRPDVALAVLDPSLPGAVPDADHWLDRGRAAILGGRPDLALDSLQRAVALEPGNVPAHRLMQQCGARGPIEARG